MNYRRSRFRARSLLSWPGLLVPVVVLVVGGSLGGWLATRSTASTSSYHLVPVASTTLSQTLSTTGTIEPANTSTLSFSAQGQVTSVDVSVGQHVTSGMVLATMSSPTLQAQVDEAKATLAQDQARLSQDQSSGASGAQIAADQASVSADQSQLDSANSALSGATLVAPASGVVTTVGYTDGEQLAGAGGGGGGGRRRRRGRAIAAAGRSGGSGRERRQRRFKCCQRVDHRGQQQRRRGRQRRRLCGQRDQDW